MNYLKDTFFWLLSILCGIFLIYLIITKNSLNENFEYSKAIIIDNFYTIRYTDYFSYKFYIDEIEYQGSGKYYHASDTILVGDTIIVIFDRTNPENNMPVRDY